MRNQNILGPWLIAPALLVASCSQGPAQLTGATRPLETTSGAGPGTSSGVVTGSAVGDVQNGPIEIFNVRVAPTGANRFYGNPGGVYRVAAGVSVEFWVEWRSAQALATVPRLDIEWGFVEGDNIHCGPCLLNKAFPEGLHTVTVRLDDRVGGVTKRTFQIDTRPLPPDVTGEFGPTHTFEGLTSFHYITQGGCSVGGGDAVDAAYFCTRFYGNRLGKTCTAVSYVPGVTPFSNYPKMHKRNGCTSLGLDIAGTVCDGGACKIGDWSENTSGLNNIICRCN